EGGLPPVGGGGDVGHSDFFRRSGPGDTGPPPKIWAGVELRSRPDDDSPAPGAEETAGGVTADQSAPSCQNDRMRRDPLRPGEHAANRVYPCVQKLAQRSRRLRFRSAPSRPMAWRCHHRNGRFTWVFVVGATWIEPVTPPV